jgi:ABC-2 type transport system permease protein
MWTTLLTVIAKEYRQTFRDKRMVALLLVAPIIQLLVLGFAVNLEVEHVPAIIADEDRTPESRRFADALTAGDAFDRAGVVPSSRDAERMVARGDVPLAVVIPKGFQRRLTKGKPVAVQALVDGGDSNRAIVAQNAVAAFVMQRAAADVQRRVREVAAARGRRVAIPRVTVQPRILYNPTLNSQIYFVPGVAATLLLIVTMITTSMGLAREKEMGTLEQVMVTPIRPEVLILGKTLPYGLIGLIDLGLVIALGAWIFEVPIRGSLPLILFAGCLYMLTTLGVGLLVSALARTQQQAFMGGMFFIMPAILLSGFMTPVENMPQWLQPLSGFTPVRHFVEIMRGVLLKDAGFWDLSPQLAALAGMGLVVYASAAYALRRNLG